jgi:hypothetical protein
MIPDIFKQVARSMGFKRRGKYYCLSSNDLVGVVFIQKSRYANAYYVEIGIIEKMIMVSSIPPPSAYWGTSCRVCQMRSEYQDVFDAIKLKEPPYSKKRVTDGIEWCFSFVSGLTKDSELVRRVVLKKERGRYPAFWETAWAGSHLVDWAKGNQVDLNKYFSPIPAELRSSLQ